MRHHPSAPNSQIIGNQIRIKVTKNKVAPPYKSAEFDIIFGKGISKSGEILDFAVLERLVSKSGAWYTISPAIMQAMHYEPEVVALNHATGPEY